MPCNFSGHYDFEAYPELRKFGLATGMLQQYFEAHRKGVMGYQHLQRHNDGVDYILFPIIVGAKGISVGSASGYDAAQEPFD